MQACGTEEDWNRWWQNPRIFQQSPLYAYVLAGFRAFTGDLIYVLMLQSLWAIALCGCIGWIAARISGRKAAGWAAFMVSAIYAPFHAYSVLLLRDGLSYTITAALIAVLVELQVTNPAKAKQLWLSAAAGALLGIGYLTRETFFLIIPVVWLACGWMLARRKQSACIATLIISTVLVLTPLFIRNAIVGAPLLSSSNRFAECFIWGQARSTDPTRFVIPTEMRQILERSQGRPLAVVRETLATHPNLQSWLKLTGSKAVAMLDPFELPDNISFYFLERMSPTVRFGLKYWMILIPGIAGLLLSGLQRDRRHAWLWLIFPMLLAGILMGVPMSRYRQILAVILIPSSIYFVTWLWVKAKESPRHATLASAAVVVGWALCLGPFARVPKARYERALDYVIAAGVYESAGRLDESEAMKNVVREKFPELIRKP
jgi:4-amino-4-deoxy-L-arabinose transferase-like glycosyltransferase